MRHIVRHALAWSLGLTIFAAFPGEALADDESATTIARERFKEGVAYYDQKNYDKARIAFLQAYALKKHPAVLLNLAQSELRSGHEVEAAKHFSMYLREAKDASESEREAAEAGLFAAKAVIGEVSITAETGATIYVDGVQEGIAPLPDAIYVSPGKHRIEARKDGKRARVTVVAQAGEAYEYTLTFSTPSERSQALQAEPARQSADGPPEHDRGAGGGREGFFSWVGHTPLAWVGSGLTLAGIGGGIGFGLAAQQNYNNADSIADQIRQAARDDNTSTTGICSDPRAVLLKGSSVPPSRVDLDAAEYRNACQKHQDNLSKGDTWRTLSLVSFGVAGAAALGTIVYYLVDAKPEGSHAARHERPPVRVGATVSPGHGFVTVQGEF